MTDKPRLIERAFPLKQTSLSSVHEKNVRHGHISTLHIWPARRPLAACRAALLATLLPDPGTPEKRRKLCERIGGTVVEKIEKKKMPNGRIVERIKEETQGGVLRWIGTEPRSGGRKKIDQHRSDVAFRESELAWFREEIKKAYGGRAPRVLDPFAGGGAIPLEAMRLGCEATAVDINPVAWFILKCTLEYPQKLAGKTHPLPDFITEDEDFMEAFYKAHPHLIGRTKKTKRQKEEPQQGLWETEDSGRIPNADLAWHVRAWGRWVLNQARKELAPFYPTYADFEPINLKNPNPYEKQSMRLVPLKDDGTPDIDALNADFSKEYLADKRNPRWFAKPTVAYLWARTVKCKNCRAIVPLLKTRWLCKKDRKRVLLTMDIATESTEDTEKVNEKNSSVSSVSSVAKKVVFGIQNDVPAHGGNAAQKREHDKRIGEGTMSRAGAKCPCCSTIMTMEDIRLEGKAERINDIPTSVVIDTSPGKAFRLPTNDEVQLLQKAKMAIDELFESLPFGKINEPIDPASTRSISCDIYGINNFNKAFNSRQQVAIGTFVKITRSVRKRMNGFFYNSEWEDAIFEYLALSIDRIVDRCSVFCRWDIGRLTINNTYSRFALSMLWDYCESNPISTVTGSYDGAVEWVAQVIDHCIFAQKGSPKSNVLMASASDKNENVRNQMDLIITDPPYYQAISYADLSDLFYIWQKQSVNLPEWHQ